LGLLALAVTPTHATLVNRVETLPLTTLAQAEQDQSYGGEFYTGTICPLIREHRALRGARIDCVDMQGPPGIAEIRIEARNQRRVLDLQQTIIREIAPRMPVFRVHQLTDLDVARPTWARTAPVWGAESGLLLALLAPGRRTRRRRPIEGDRAYALVVSPSH
jgi:hypothetical protein